MNRYVRSLIITGTRNAVKCSHSPAEHPRHRLLKYMVCEELYRLKKNFWTEASFKRGGRADVVIEDHGVIIELLHTETETAVKEKHYPLPTYHLSVTATHAEIKALVEDLCNLAGPKNI